MVKIAIKTNNVNDIKTVVDTASDKTEQGKNFSAASLNAHNN